MYQPATYAKSFANDDITYIVMMATLGWMKADTGDLQTGSANTRPNTIGNESNVATTGFAVPGVRKEDNAYSMAPSSHPTIHPFIAFITSDRRIPGFRTARLSGKEQAIVAIEGVRKALELSMNATEELKLTVTVVKAARRSASRT